MEKKEHEFTYTYSAKQQEEIKRIRQRYIPPAEDKMEQLRKLDESAARPGTIASIAVGAVGTLLLGLGMTCTMVWTHLFVLGIFVGVIGITGVAVAYPLYIQMTKKQREKIAPQVLALSEELMGTSQ